MTLDPCGLEWGGNGERMSGQKDRLRGGEHRGRGRRRMKGGKGQGRWEET